MTTFESLGLSNNVLQSLTHMGFKAPTPIQAQAIPLALSGRDIMGSAQTGTGKTGAFAIPLIEHLLNSDTGTALVLTPTRELGKQVMEAITQMLGRHNHINTAFIIGGEAMQKQFQQLKRNPRLIVGTPGRVTDHLKRRSLNLDKTDFLVLDETDRMLDMGFSIQLDEILKYIPSKRQTLMFSATLPDNIMRLSKKYLNNPERVSVGSTFNPIKTIDQQVIKLSDSEKYPELVNQLQTRTGSIIVFVKTKHGADKMAKRLKSEGLNAQAIHGDLRQRQRDRAIKDFREKRYEVLIGTDVIARGLDIPHVEHVINYDLPQVPEDYIHRIGRTGRAGAEGEALNLVTPKDNRKWHAIECLMDPEMKQKSSPKPMRGSGSRGRGRGQGGGGQGGGRGRPNNDNNSWGNKSKSSNGGNGGNRGKSWGDKPKSRDGNGGDNKSWGDKPRNSEGGNGGNRGKSWGDKPRNSEGGNGGNKSWGDKPRSNGGNGGNGGQRNHSWDGKPKSRDGGDNAGRSYDKPRSRDGNGGDNKSWGNKPRNSEGGNGGNRGKSWGDKPQLRDGNGGNKSWGDKPRSNGGNGGNKSWGDKPKSRDGNDTRGGDNRGKSNDNPRSRDGGAKAPDRKQSWGSKPRTRDNNGNRPDRKGGGEQSRRVKRDGSS